MKEFNVVLIGAGSRGRNYTNIMKEEGGFRVIAVAEPIREQREYIRKKHDVALENCFESWEDLLAKPKMADIAIIATQDTMHYAPAMKAIEMGYHLLLEKPVAPTARECADIANAAKEKGVKVLVCHVLRYAKFFSVMKDMIQRGMLGKVLSIHHDECVGNVHQSHSYVRGNWGNEKRSSNMLLAKSCHDVDIIQWLIDSPCTMVQSFGNLSYFTGENMKAGAPERCIDGCPHGDSCHYNAVKLYLEDEENTWIRGTATHRANPTNEEVEHVLRTEQYGKCVYQCDNDVVDHQVVNMEFANGALASFHMSAFNKGGRHIRVMGTEGELFGDMKENHIRYFSFTTREYTDINPLDVGLDDSIIGGHGGGDTGLIQSFYQYLADEISKDELSEIGISVSNHLIVFAAEESRKGNVVVDVNKFIKSYIK